MKNFPLGIDRGYRIRILLCGALSLLVLTTRALERLEPIQGCYFGVNLGDTDTIPRLTARLGLTPAVYVRFFQFPFPPDVRASVSNFLGEVTATGGIAMLSLEPVQGLITVTTNAGIDLGNLCAAYESQGIGGIFIRFAHEMNGHWYPWGQQPIAYKQTFRLLSASVHARTTRTALVWAPNHGMGYPFGADGASAAQPGTAEFLALDTDGDGILTESDDMYGPYYPGDDVVDWVGMTIYHWGVSYPWLENELPRPYSFADALTGNGGRLPNFYARYCAGGTRNKPLAIPETAAFFNPEQPGPEEFAIKQAWWQQVFNLSGANANAIDVAAHFPKLKCINWFDHYKRESEAQDQWIDWRISAHPLTRSAFVSDLRTLRDGQPYFLTAQELRWQQSRYAITVASLPAILPLQGAVSAALSAKAETGCDLVIDLLDQTLRWCGGTRVPVAAGTQTLNASFALTRKLMDGAAYRWSIFLTPTGSNYLNALAWLKTSEPVARALTPLVQLVATPPVASPGSNFTARVRYVADESSVVQVNLLDSNLSSRGHAAASVSKGEGMIELMVIPQAGLASGSYFLECSLAHSPTNSQSDRVRSERVPILISELVTQDRLMAVPVAVRIPAGEVFRVAVSYAAGGNREVHLDLYDGGSNCLASAVQPVAPGSGIRDMAISYPSASPGEYLLRAGIMAPRQTPAQTLASSSDLRINVLALDYQQWIESQWGVVLANDPVDPQQDPDRDGVSNDNEFVALTDPRDGTDFLRSQLTITSGKLIVSWRSAIGRTYQLFRASGLQNNTWSPVDNMMIGTGQRLQVSIHPDTASPHEFYQVQVIKP